MNEKINQNFVRRWLVLLPSSQASLEFQKMSRLLRLLPKEWKHRPTFRFRTQKLRI